MAIWYYGRANARQVASLAAQRIEQFLKSGDFHCLDSSVGLMLASPAGRTTRMRRQMDAAAHRRSSQDLTVPPPPPPPPVPQQADASGKHPAQKAAKAKTDSGRPPALPALAGQLSDQTLPQVLQFLNQNQKTGELHLQTDARDALFSIRKGDIVYAESGGYEGVDAVYACAKETEGAFWFNSMEALPKRIENVQASMMDIAFECCRLLDESRRDEESLE